MSEYDSFINLMKYKESENQSPIENFTTELFVFLLKYLISTKNNIIYSVLDEFNFEKNIDIKKLNIITQKQFDTMLKDKIAIPDIVIEYNDTKKIIEVKVDADLNNYGMGKKTINQLELYSKIEEIDEIYLLTKRVIFVDNLNNNKIKKRVFWSRIYHLLENSNDFVVKSYLHFLEENGMKTNKLNKNILTAIDALATFSSLMEQSWNYYDDCKPLSFGFSNNGYFGAYIKNKTGKNILWIGLTDDDDDKIVVHFYDEKQRVKYKNKLEAEWIIDKIDITKIIDAKDSEEQKEILAHWFDGFMNKKMVKELYS